MQRVAHVDTERTWRGGQVQLAAFLEGTSSAFEHHLLVPFGSPWLDRAPDGVQVHRLPLWGRRIGRLDVSRRLRSLRPDLVGVHTAHALAMVPESWRRLVHRRVDFRPSPRALSRMRSASRVLAVSDAVAEILRRGGVERVRVVYDGVQHDVPLAPVPECPRLLAVGALVPHKDHATLLRAMVDVPAPLDIAGEGPLRPRLARRIRRLGLEDRVRLLGHIDDVPERLIGASALVHASKEEGLGQAVLEALARGVPVVATRAGGLPEAVGADGRLVPARDPKALAAALRDVLADGGAARRHLAEVHDERALRFGVGAMVRATEAAYREAVDKAPAMPLHRLALLPLVLLVGVGCASSVVETDDVDADGFSADVDCDDGDPFVYPGAPEHCNGRDDDCNGAIDDDATSGSTLWYLDDDGDGFGDPDSAVRSCARPDGHIALGDDCDDGDAGVHPGLSDGCDGVDTDCDGTVDENPDRRFYLDEDGDGHGGFSLGWGCIGTTATESPTDCDDGNNAVFPGADELCNGGIDDDCDGFADDLDPDGPVDPATWYADVDLDGFGDPNQVVFACEAPTGNVTADDSDCDDDDPDTYPDAPEGCEPVDRNCDGAPPDDTAWWSDAYPVRVPIEVSSPIDASQPVLSLTMDLTAAAGKAFDARTMALVVQDCSGAGAVRLDAEFTDGLGGVFDGALTLPVDDAVGGLHAVLDRDLAAGETLPLALYLSGPISSTPGDAAATPSMLESGVVTVAFDLVEGGWPEVSVDALAADGVVLEGRVGSAPVSGAVGPEGLAGPQAYDFATEATVLGGEMVAAIDVVTPYLVSDPGDARVEQRVRWVAISGRPEVYGWVRTEATEAGAVAGLSSLGFGPGALRDEAVATDHGGAYASWSSPSGHLAFGWVQPPTAGASVEVAGDVLRLRGDELALPNPSVAAGTLLVDERLLVVRGGEGPVVEAVMDELLSGPVDVFVGEPEESN